MASTTASAPPSLSQHLRNPQVRTLFSPLTACRFQKRGHCTRGLPFSLKPCEIFLRPVSKPISAVGSGLEASITDPKENRITVKEVQIVVESQDENKIQLRVDVPGRETQIVFEKVLRNLARTAPPIPGFRREKGGKTTNVPTDFLVQILGEDRVTKFVIQEIVASTIADYVQKENLNVKDNKTNTLQQADELKKSFSPGNDFGFSATLELEKPEKEDIRIKSDM